MKYLFIDANNLACRHAFAHTEMKSDNSPTSVHYGFFSTLIGLKEKYPSYQFLICWDGKSQRRKVESEEAVSKGIVPESYKSNRKKEEIPQPLLDFYFQAPYLKRALEYTGIPQIMVENFEADDVIGSYVYKYKKESDIIINTSDHDYFQLLDKNVSIFDGMKGESVILESWQEEWGVSTEEFLHVCALMGDSSDNIFGTPSIGIKTALKEIKKHKTWFNVIKYYENEYKDLIAKYDDKNFYNDKSRFDRLKNVKTNPDNKNSRNKYPDIYWGIPYIGLAEAVEDGKIDIPKSSLMLLMFKDRTELAYSLKKMDTNIEGLPEIYPLEFNKEKLIEYFDYYEIESLRDALDLFV